MSLILRAEGATFTKFKGWTSSYPVGDGLVGEYYFGSNDSGASNRAGGADLTVVGTPTVNTISFVGSQPNGYDTGMSETEQFTFIAVAKRPSGPAAMVANFNTSANYGTLFSLSGTGQVQSQIGLSGGFSEVSLYSPSSVVGDVWFFALTVGATRQKIFAGRGNALASATSADFGSARQTKPNTLRIGSHYYVGSTTASIEIYAAAIHNKALTDEQIGLVYQAIRMRYVALGVTGL